MHIRKKTEGDRLKLLQKQTIFSTIKIPGAARYIIQSVTFIVAAKILSNNECVTLENCTKNSKIFHMNMELQLVTA